MKVKLDKIASVTAGLQLPSEVELLDRVDAREGTIVVVQALREKTVYDEIELISGEMVKVLRGDIIAGVLGERKALRGFVGTIPSRINVGDTLHLLNLGGTVGLSVSANRDFGSPLEVRVLGSPRLPFSLNGHCPNIKDTAISWRETLTGSAPIVLISATCMNSGKTTAACVIIEHLALSGYRVAAAKLTGIALMRDVNRMKEHGAQHALSFVNAGLPSTTNLEEVLPAAKGVLHELNRIASPEVIVAELGDGILGGYGVDLILRDADLMAFTKVHVVCANDPVGAWGADQIFRNNYGMGIDVMSGPATDNEVGIAFIEQQLGIPAANARNGGHLAGLVEGKLQQ